MSESPINELPKGCLLRNAVAKQLRKARNLEKRGKFPNWINRNSADYAAELSGIQHFFSYVRNLGNSNLILDIGAGEMVGVNQLSRSSFGKGLRFEATILRRPETKSNLKKINVHQVPVETLHGISDKSVGGVMGVFSIAYSAAPALAVGSINRVLVPGGVIKATFLEKQANWKGWAGLKKYTDFKREFRELDYDVATDHWNPENGKHESILLAIKPGGKNQITAEKLLQADRESVAVQVLILNRDT